MKIATWNINSVKARIDGLRPGDTGWPEAAYNGDYIADIAADFTARKTVKADDRDPWHHEMRALGGEIELSFPIGATLAIPA